MDKLWISFWVCGYPQSYPQSYPQDILKNGFLWYHDALFEVGWFLVGVLMKNASLFDGIFEDELGVSDVPKRRTKGDELPFLDTSDDAEELWGLCLVELKAGMSEMDFNQWIRPITPTLQGDTLVLSAINPVYIERINKNYLSIITAVLSEQTQGRISLKTQLKSRSAPKASKKKTKKVHVEGSNTLNPLYTFDNFVKGKSNALAYNACVELSKKLGQETGGVLDSHLLFVYGASGLGKTHLISAVAHRYQKAGLNYCFFDKDSFFKATTTAFRLEQGGEKGEVERLMERIRQTDLLMIDDIHMIKSKSGSAVLDVLTRLFSDFTQGNKRLILASDRPPARMTNFDERFLSRFSRGLSLPIDPPDMETRIQILHKKAEAKSMVLPKECAIFIAQNVPFDVRGLEGALDQVLAYAITTGMQVDLRLVRQALRDRIEVKTASVNAESIRDVVAKYYGVPVKELMGKKRSRHIARPRQVAMALMRELTQDSFPEIGQAFGGRDHTTVMHACQAIAELRETDTQMNKDYQSLMVTLRG